jgi:hypothetical protein
MKITKFGCVEMQHRGAEKIIEKTSKMTRDQELKFWQERSQYLKKCQESIKQKITEYKP